MKKTLLLKTMLLLCALVAGSGSVWADEVFYTFTTVANSSNNAYASTYDVTISGLDWNVPGNQYEDGGLRIGGKGGSTNTSVSTFDRIITGKSKMGAAITKITFNHGGVSNANCVVNSVTLTVASMSDFSDGVDYELTPSFSVSTDGSFDFTPSSPATEWDKDSYYKFTINQTITGNKNYFLLVKSIVFYKEGGGSEPSITLGSNTINATEAAVSTTSIDVTYNNLTNYDADVIFYEANGTDAATYDHSWITAEINATTKNLDYSITANTGAARTAYMRVYALGDEGEAQSSLITVTQAKKTVARPTFNLDGGSYMQGTSITISSEGNTIYYNLTTNGSDPATPTDASTKYTAPIVLGSGTTKITAIAYDTYGNVSSTTNRTYTSITPVTLPFSWAGSGKSALTALDGVFGAGLGTDYGSDHNPYLVKFDTEGDNIVIYTDGQPAKVTIGVKMIGGASTSTIKVQESANGIGDFENVEDLTISGSQGDIVNLETTKDFAATTRVIKLLFNKGSNVGVGPITITAVPATVTITNAEYATYCNATKALDFSTTGITVYTATDNETYVALNEVATGKVPANTPVVLYKAGADGSAIDVPVIASADAIAGTNDLRVSTGTDVENMYVLAKNPTIGFYPWAGTIDLSAGKIYLQGNASYSAREFIGFDFGFGGETTGINAVNGSRFTVNGSQVYNLNGQRIANPKKGLYIVNGKKVAIK